MPKTTQTPYERMEIQKRRTLERFGYCIVRSQNLIGKNLNVWISDTSKDEGYNLYESYNKQEAKLFKTKEDAKKFITKYTNYSNLQYVIVDCQLCEDN